MVENTSNDNGVSPSVGCEAPAHPATLLVESLIHGLVAKAVLSVGDAIEIVDVAAQVARGLDECENDVSPTAPKSVSILEAIGASLSIDKNGD